MTTKELFEELELEAQLEREENPDEYSEDADPDDFEEKYPEDN